MVMKHENNALIFSFHFSKIDEDWKCILEQLKAVFSESKEGCGKMLNEAHSINSSTETLYSISVIGSSM